MGKAAHCEIYGTDYPTPDGTCIRDYIHIIDLAQAHILGLAAGKQGFYNLGNGDGYSVREVIDTCAKVTGKKIPAVEKPRRPGTRAPLVEEPHRTGFKGGLEGLIGKLLDAHHEGGRSGGRDLFDLVTEFLGLAAQSLRQ